MTVPRIWHIVPRGWKAYRLWGVPESPVETQGARFTWTPTTDKE